MATAFGYFLNMLPYMLISLPFILLWRWLRVKQLEKRNLISPRCREILMVIFVMFLVGLVSQTVLSEITLTATGFEIVHRPGGGGLNLKLFDVFRLVEIETIERGKINFFLINIVGNILVFVPIGFFACLLWRKPSFLKALLSGLLTSLAIELAQFPLERGTDIDDLWLNTLGALLGWVIYIAVQHNTDTGKYRIQKRNNT
ncbi:MAG TPA: VanZ family protein [Oscillospiraceae bacterium]|nr:VanZ family protein [Oscillospiraceae bacterium]HPF55443.1 VanZ family protein [Clostridiales bacterium]HPK36243.1 VanZ family protein [Oscillospiraceae bacterium]HPR75489.1 VanZ family protein [Oscillospiraceae bacterium]